jgi:hypothetical protein
LIFSTPNYTDQTYFRFDSRAEQQFEVHLRYGQHPELYPNRRGELVPGTYCERVFRDCRMQTCYVQSPGYPGIYPRNLHCKYSINTRLPFIKLHIENEEFSVGGVRCSNLIECPVKGITSNREECMHTDHIKVYDGKDERSPLIAVFCGVGKFPVSLIGTGSDVFVEVHTSFLSVAMEIIFILFTMVTIKLLGKWFYNKKKQCAFQFITTAAGPLSSNSGFHFNVGHWPGHVDTKGKSNGTCDWTFTSEDLLSSGDKQGLFWSVSHWYPAGTRCSYLMQGTPTEIVRLVFPSFRIEKISSPIEKSLTECAESLTIYDADHADDSRIIKTFCDTSRPLEKFDFVSTGNSLYVLFESKTGSYAGSSLYYWSSYDFFNNTKFGEAVPNTICDEAFVPWGGRTEGKFASPVNTLIYKAETTSSVVCTFRFESVRRLFARVLVRIDNVNFKYNQDSCVNCFNDRVDKIVLNDDNNKSICVCKENSALTFPVTITSSGTSASVVLSIDSRHSVANYFKSPVPIFEGSYKFIHGPLCGATRLGPSSDGKLRFPYYYNPELRENPVHCLWELSVHPAKDLWINLEKLVFSTSSKSCSDAKLELYLTSTSSSSNKHSSSALLTLCGDSNVGDRKTEISSQLPIIPSDRLKHGGLTIKLEASTASKLNFIISWTELNRMDTTKSEQRAAACPGYLCPGTDICIARDLLCNGILNCPNGTNAGDESDESDVNCRGIKSENQFVVLNYRFNFSWVTASVFGGGLALAVSVFCILCFCCLCGGRGKRLTTGGGSIPRRYNEDREDDFLT